tara:strand:+ start:293 stop:2593 length:2301 start_codon:yes stop_codon:yes gene_type:complete
MAKKEDKVASRVRTLFNNVNTQTRIQWEYVNQKGFDFANDNQLTDIERRALEEQGMPTFTINRIMPVVEMLNFYATANDPRWQAIGADGSDTTVAAVFSDIADYVWYISDGSTLYANAVNDAITKSIGYLLISVDADSDQGMGDVKVSQPEPFDVYVDPKSRDMLFRDASFVMIRKVLPESHLISLFPDSKAKIKKAASDQNIDYSYSEKSMGSMQKDFDYKDIRESESINNETGEQGKLLELFEVYEKVKVAYVNVFHKVPPNEEAIAGIKEQVIKNMQEMATEMEVAMKEQEKEMAMAVEAGEMIPERFELEMKKLLEENKAQLQGAEQSMMAELENEASKIENKIISKKEYNIMIQDPIIAGLIVDKVDFFGTRIKQTCVIGNKTIYEKTLPEKITEYPIIPLHFKWTGTPYPISAVSPLVGKQREMNKAHQLMLHNASLGSSLRWMHEEGSIDTDYWEKYSSSPGALLPIRPGSVAPTAIQPAPLSNAFFSIVNEGKQDMEYLAGIYGASQGDTGSQHDTYKGMLAQDEYGTRRVKQWMKNSIEPALKQLGKILSEYTRTVYTAHKVFQIVQPNSIESEKSVEINVPLYNDFGDEIERFNDYGTAKFDIRIVAGSTLPVNRWAYLAELKELMQLGVIDDIALLAETDIKNKEELVERKSQLSQMQGQVSSMEEQVKDKDGTIETLERQLVQAGIKNKVMQATVEVDKKRNQVNSGMDKQLNEAKAQNKVLMESQKLNHNMANKKLGLLIDAEINKEKQKNKS